MTSEISLKVIYSLTPEDVLTVCIFSLRIKVIRFIFWLQFLWGIESSCNPVRRDPVSDYPICLGFVRVCCWARTLGRAGARRLRGMLGCALHAGSRCRTPTDITARGSGAAISSWQGMLNNLRKIHRNIFSPSNVVRFISSFNGAVTSCHLEFVRSHCTWMQVDRKWLKEQKFPFYISGNVPY